MAEPLRVAQRPLAEPPDDVFGATWAARRGPSPEAALDVVRFRPPCPVCGHPTGDCTRDGEAHG